MKSKEQTKYYVYLRKSSESEDKQVQSIERQQDEVNKIIDAYNLNIVGTFQESRSAKLPDNRPEFSKMITGIRKGYANGIVCWHINRLSRNPLESGIVQQLLEDGKIQRIVTKDRMYTAEDNAIIYSVETSLATQYSKDLGKMVKSGMDKKVSIGIPPIQAPLGYLNTRYKEHGTNKIIIDEKLFPLVRKLWEMVLTKNYTIPQILKMMNDEMHIKKSQHRKNENKFMSLSGLYNLFTNPFYTGYFKYKGELHKGVHPAMISFDEFELVQEIIGRKLKPKFEKHEYAFTGLFICENCGSAITATRKSKWVHSLNKFNSYTYYYCSRKKNSAKNCIVNKPITDTCMEEIITQELSVYDIDIDFKNQALKAISLIIGEQAKNVSETKKYQETQISKLQKEIKNLLSLRISESITDEEFNIEKQEREAQIIRIQGSVNSNLLTSVEIQNKCDKKLSSIINLSTNFKNESIVGKKSILNMIGSNYRLIDKNLIYTNEKWVSHLVSNKNGIKAEISRLELNKTIDTYNYLCDFRNTIPLLWKLVEIIRTNR